MSNCVKTKAPVYLREARLEAGCANRGIATLKVPYSPETIGRHERGEVPIDPNDAVQYANGYKRPDILLRYCADCPVGRSTGRTATDRPLPFATLRVSRMIDDAQEVVDRLEQIAFDGVVDDKEQSDFCKALDFLKSLDETIEEMLLLGMSAGIIKAAPGSTGSGKIKK